MKIAASEVSLIAGHSLVTEQRNEESLRLLAGVGRADRGESGNRREGLADRVTLSAGIGNPPYAPPGKTSPVPDEPDNPAAEDPRLRTIRLTLEALTGKRIRMSSFSEHSGSTGPVSSPVPGHASVNDETGPGTWGVEYHSFHSYREQEKMRVVGIGTVLTEEGREFTFEVDLTMERDYLLQGGISLRAGDARLVDPLIINFSGRGGGLSDYTFSFDLDADGNEEEIAAPAPGSGFLVLDGNGDDRINDGRELFGPATGNGFAELARYDLDENGWLDENDAVFAELQIWMRDRAGNDHLLDLNEAGIGALLLAPVESPFSLRDAENNVLGRIRETSIGLLDDGRPVTIQEIDLAM